jgi:F0F1-type ATP synthase membrane subunit b/b'
MSIEFLDDSTLWVSLSFIIFLCITLNPMLTQLSGSLEKKIDDLKKNIEESKQLKLEAEKLYEGQLEKQKDNSNLIKRIKEDTNKEIKRIKSQIEKDVEQTMLRRINNYNLISSQMENNLKNDMKKLIMEKAIKYTEIRIKKNLSNKQNLKLVENSIINIPKNFF